MSCSSPCSVARRSALVALAAAWVAPGVRASDELPPEVRSALPDARLHGRARLRFFGLAIYDSTLWSAARIDAARPLERPLALELRYARSFAGTDIAERSLTEMARQGPVAPADAARWLARLREIFPDVRNGDRLTGLWRPGAAARFCFFYNGQPRGEITDATLAERFFLIWLGPQTSEPGLRDALLAGPGS